MLEAWIAALAGEKRSEAMGRDSLTGALVRLGIGGKDTGAMVERVDSAELDGLPADAMSLRAWLDRARRVLGVA